MNTEAQQPEVLTAEEIAELEPAVVQAIHQITTVPEFTRTALALIEFERAYKDNVYAVATKPGMEEAKAARAVLRGTRTSVEKRRKELTAPLLKRQRDLKADGDAIMSRIAALEDPIDNQIKAEEARVEAERLAVIQKEQARVDGHRARIAAWRNLPGEIAGRPLAGMRLALQRLEEQESITAENFEEFAQEASDAYAACLGRVRDMVRSAEEAEAAAERARQIEAEHAAQAQRIADLEREAKERREADARREREEQEAIERKEREAREAAERAQREAEAEARRQVEEAERAEREAAQAAERERLEREAAEQRERADQAERQRREDAAKAEEERQASLTLRTAAQALVDHCLAKGMGHDQPVMDMNAILLVTEGDIVPTKGKRAAAKPARVAR